MTEINEQGEPTPAQEEVQVPEEGQTDQQPEPAPAEEPDEDED